MKIEYEVGDIVTLQDHVTLHPHANATVELLAMKNFTEWFVKDTTSNEEFYVFEQWFQR